MLVILSNEDPGVVRFQEEEVTTVEEFQVMCGALAVGRQTTAGGQATPPSDEHEASLDDRDPKRSDAASSRREYERRVRRLFEASTAIDEFYRAQKLMERLTGVERLLSHLWQELEPLEYLRIFSTPADFYKNFRRSPGQEHIAYGMEFRTHLKRLEEIGATEGFTKAYWFIEKAVLSGDLRKQIVAAAGGECEYRKLRKALMAIVPRVNKEEDASGRPSPGNRHWKTRNHPHPRQVHATTDDTADDSEKDEMEAAKKRAQIEKARGFTRSEFQEAHGKTVFGHWHGVIEEQLSESVNGIRDDFFAPDSVYVTTEVFEDHKVGEETNHEEKVLEVTVLRRHGAAGKVACAWRTEDNTAKAGTHYAAGNGVLEFEHGQMVAKLPLTVLPAGRYQLSSTVRIVLSSITGGAKFDASTEGGRDLCMATVVIQPDPAVQERILRIHSALAVNWTKAHTAKSNWTAWKEQIINAVKLTEDDEEEEEDGQEQSAPAEKRRGCMQYINMALTAVLGVPWKIFFSVIPPPGFCDGWLCFFCSLGGIGLLTAIVGDLAALLGCVLDIGSAITAITLVALGTSLPDTFASRQAAVQDPTADASVGNVTGSNSVNVFLGLGMPWTLGALFWTIGGADATWNERFQDKDFIVGTSWAGGDDEKLVFSQPRARGQRYPLYSRTWNRSREDLETAVMQLYGLDSRTNHALILPSGMGAIGALISSVAAGLAGETWTLVHGDELYCEGQAPAVDRRSYRRLDRIFVSPPAPLRLAVDMASRPSSPGADADAFAAFVAMAGIDLSVGTSTSPSSPTASPLEDTPVAGVGGNAGQPEMGGPIASPENVPGPSSIVLWGASARLRLPTWGVPTDGAIFITSFLAEQLEAIATAIRTLSPEDRDRLDRACLAAVEQPLVDREAAAAVGLTSVDIYLLERARSDMAPETLDVIPAGQAKPPKAPPPAFVPQEGLAALPLPFPERDIAFLGNPMPPVPKKILAAVKKCPPVFDGMGVPVHGSLVQPSPPPKVARTVRYVSETQGKKMSTCTVDIREHSRLRSLFAEKGAAIRLFHFESCTNPSGQLMDFAFLKELRHLAPHCIFACDNTWLSGALFNPFEHGADIVVESMTKYVSAGRCIGGFVAGASSLMAPVLSWIKAFGVFVGADHCEIFSQGLQTINRRMTATSATAEALAAYLEAHPAVNRVMYPMLSSHPTYHLARLYLTRGGPGCIWFHVSASKKTVMSVLTRSDGPGCGGPECKTSFGAASSRVDPWPQPAPSDACDWPRARAAQGLPGTWIRLAVGHAEALEKTKTAVEVLLAQLCPMATATSTAATQSSKEDRQEDALQPEAHSMRWKRRS
ncbi:Slc8a2 [Symbiodinium sp. KB8]|nr:Slc8a2 [Symbiodinium sp. KB8]